ncbi:hypothetical protein MARPU_04835 [Marichromatium purpuratum 984]|uniref:Lipoprotein n=1 Tax=Marichromatium purpuratum 984 TaxID=765910 RepID=W0E2I0_MARPU|nr:hypothetical protein [Marichromatium purpuratum]AHF03286.1 hypothetical protein MARPU_04835 [Marichromatium purpuratum 984]
MSRIVVPVVLLGLLAGCALIPPQRLGGIAVEVPPEEYGRRLCEHLEIEVYATCVSQVIDNLDRPRPEVPSPGRSTSGPVVAVVDGEVFSGDYRSTLFTGELNLTSPKTRCRGGYSAFSGDPAAIYEFHCEDGRSGWADLVRDLSGRNGIGRLAFSDGAAGQLVFGHAPLGSAEPYPYLP